MSMRDAGVYDSGCKGFLQDVPFGVVEDHDPPNLQTQTNLKPSIGPAILFLDELDSVGFERGELMHEATRRILSVLLTKMEGCCL